MFVPALRTLLVRLVNLTKTPVGLLPVNMEERAPLESTDLPAPALAQAMKAPCVMSPPIMPATLAPQRTQVELVHPVLRGPIH